jgi:hypothetical protein
VSRSETCIALFRGINVGGRHMLPMKELAGMFESLGASRVRTYIQSGNVVFRPVQIGHKRRAAAGRAHDRAQLADGPQAPRDGGRIKGLVSGGVCSNRHENHHAKTRYAPLHAAIGCAAGGGASVAVSGA